MKRYYFTDKFSLAAVASMLFLALILSPIAHVQSAELQVLAGGAMTAPMKEIAAQFESATGHKLVIRFGTTPELIKLATTGGPFDLGVVPREVFKDAAAQAQFMSGTMIDIARVGLGVAVRSGAPKPDISTPDALRQTLLKAQSIASIPDSAAGSQVLRVFERLGIGEAMKAKMKAQAVTRTAGAVGCQRRRGAWRVSHQRADGTRIGSGRSIPCRSSAGGGIHCRARCEHQTVGSRQGIHCLPDNARGDCGDKSQRDDAGLVRQIPPVATERRPNDSAAIHSITLSARTRMESGNTIPSSFADLMFIANSNVVGCSIGRSPGFAPLRILST